MKKTILTLMAILATTQAFAYGFETPGQKFYSGKITHEQYLDSLGAPRFIPPVRVTHSNGTGSTITYYPNGSGVINNSNGTWSSFGR